MHRPRGRLRRASPSPRRRALPEYRITGNASEEDWQLLRDEVAAFESSGSASLAAATSDAAALASGEILSETERRDDGMIEEMTTGVVNVPFEQFVRKVFPSEWGLQLYGHEGGEVEELEHDAEGRSVRQQERMVLETPMSKYLSWLGGIFPAFKHLDMTKTEQVEYGRDSARVRWRVYASDNDTVAQDIGYVNFQGTGATTTVTFHSAHKYTNSYTWPFSWGPLNRINDALTAMGLSDYFVNAVEHYRSLAEG